MWVFWTLNFVIGLAFSLTAAFNGKSIDALYAKVADGDRTTNNLIGGLIGTSAWGVVLCALFALFSFVVLLRKVGCGGAEGSKLQGFRVQYLGFRVQSLKRVQGLFRV